MGAVDPRARRLLERVLHRGTPFHAYLFAGPPGLGQRELALQLAQALHCRAPGGRPCGGCDECQRIAGERHPAVRGVRPAGASIRLEQVREATRWLEYAPRGHEWRVVILEDAERLTPEAANRLLKTLEEPPPRVTFVLLSAVPERLPETLRSRCQVVPFRAVAEADLVEALQADGEPAPRAAALARLAGGSPGRARELRELGVLEHLRPAVLEGLLRLAGGDPLEALEVADGWSRCEDPECLLGLAEAMLRDACVLRRGLAVPLDNPDLEEPLTELAARVPPQASLDRWLETTAAARRALAHHAPRSLVMEVLCLRLQAGFQAGAPPAGAWMG